jgi:hypothetical protein
MEINGWDWLLAVTLESINDQLAKYQPLSNFDIAGKSGLLQQDVHLTGTFGKWEIQGGSGQALNIGIPVTRGSISITGTTSRSIDLTGAIFVISTTLNFSPATNNTSELKFDLKTPAAEGQTPTETEVGFLNIISGTEKVSDNDAKVAGFFLCKSLVENAAKVDFIFASILDAVVGDNSSWLIAKHVLYAIHKAEGSDENYLCIGGCINAATTPPTQVLLAPELVTKNPVAVIAMSKDLFLKTVVIPRKPPTPSFPEECSSMSYSNTLSIEASNVVYSASYSAVIKHDVFLMGELTVANVRGSIAEKMGVVFNASNQTLNFSKDPKPSIRHSEQANVGGAILSGILSILGFGTLADLCIELGTMSLMPTNFFSAVNSFNDSRLGATKLAHGKSFKPTSATLNDVFYLTGNLN